MADNHVKHAHKRPEWSPLPMLAQGKVTQAFLPLDKHPSLRLSGFYKNLYPGDEVYLFETNNMNWARGYLIVQPLPVDFISKSSDLDKLPEQQVSVVILPLSHINIEDRFPVSSSFSPPALADFDTGENNLIPSVYELQLSNSKARNGELVDDYANVRLKPPLPMVRLESRSLLDELAPSLALLASHIYSFYSVGEYSLYEKLSELFDQLIDISFRLKCHLLTKNEKLLGRKQASLLLANISKFLSSKGVNRFEKHNKSSQLKSDTSGYEAITARDIDTGELIDYSIPQLEKQKSPKDLAQIQLSAALSPNFPVANNLEDTLAPTKSTKFDKALPSQILVDFKDVTATSRLNPKGFMGMTVYLYLRSAKKILTESFAIEVNPHDGFSLDKLSAALFRNIPGTEIDHGKVYLVVVCVENIDIAKNLNTAKSLKVVKKGLAAGVADISRIFSRHSGALASGKAHQFTIKLFGSYVSKSDNTTLDPANMNFGWGELVNRIINGSQRGVAVNPRAEKVVVTIKEFKDGLEHFAQDFDSSADSPNFQIKTQFFDPYRKDPEDRVYLTLGKADLSFNSAEFPGDLISIQILNSGSKSKIRFSKGTNEHTKNYWNFTSVYSNEVIGEVIKINGVKDAEPSESVTLRLFVNFELRAEGELHITSKSNILEYNKNNLFVFKSGGQSIAAVELTTSYVGKTFNIDKPLERILSWRKFYNLPKPEERTVEALYCVPETEGRLIDALKLLNQAEVQQTIKYFKELILSLLEIFYSSSELKLQKLTAASYYAFIHLLDIVVARNEQYTYLYQEFINESIEGNITLPSVGNQLLSLTSVYFEKAATEWNYVGRSICRVLPILVRVSVLTLDGQNMKEFKTSWGALYQALKSFFSLKSDTILSDQQEVLQYVDLTLSHLRGILSDEEVVHDAMSFLNRVSSRGLSSSGDQPASQIKAREVKLFMTKLLLINRFLNSWVFESTELHKNTIKFFFYAINWSLEPYSLPVIDLSVLRLANSCLVSIASISWKAVVEKNDAGLLYARSCSRLLPTVAQLLSKIHTYTRTNQLFEPKRSFTHIFPNSYPFNQLIIDSVSNEVVLVEILVELGVIYSFIGKIANVLAGPQGFNGIIELSKNDELFNSSDYFIKSFTKEDLLSVIQANHLLIQSKFFPSEKWISLHALFVESTITATELIKFIMIRDHIPPPISPETFDRSLWSKYLKSLTSIATATPSSICHLAEVPRKAAWKITRDIRIRCANVLMQAWDCLGWDSLKTDQIRFQLKRTSGYQAEFIQDSYGILENLMSFCLQRDSQCQIVGVKILWSIIVSELLVQETLEEPPINKLLEVEKGCLVGLDKFFKFGAYAPGIYEQRNFIKRLKMVVRLDPEDESFPDVYNFIQNLSDFLENENDLLSVPSGEEFDDERTFHNLDVLRHLMRVNNAKKFNASIDDLYERNLSKNNYVQAALCLELLASTYDWDVEKQYAVSIKPKFPAQSAFERKEALYKLIAANLIKGNKPEKAVSVYNELSEAYDKINFDLKGLSFVHSKLSQLYLDLTTLDRSTPTYFKVLFVGYGFPKPVRGRSFIYEGLPFEHINSIHNRLLRLHVGAKILSSDEEASRLSKNIPNGKYLHIVTVKPQMDFENNHGNLSTTERLYMENKNLRFFTTSRRLQKSTSVLDLWVEETTYETYNTFPTLMNRSEVIKTTSIKLSPIQNALRTLSTKIQDLANAESGAQKALKENVRKSTSFNELSRNLSGTVDAPVNGGISQYREFLTNTLYTSNEELENEISLLKKIFDHLTIVIYRCLFVHGQLVPDTLRESHQVLIRLFKKNFHEEIARTGVNPDELEVSLASHPSPLKKIDSSASSLPKMDSPSPSMVSRFASTANSVSNSSISGASVVTRVETSNSDKSKSSSSKMSSLRRAKILGSWRQSRTQNGYI